MSKADTVLKIIGETKVISIIRGIEGNDAETLIKALQDGGINTLEITMNTPSALSIIEKASSIGGLTVGAGTVLTQEMAKQSIEAGAQFVLSPSLDLKVIEYCLKHQVLPVPGVLTPTELYTAFSHGAELLKIFPAGSLGPQYIKDLLGPFKGMKLLPVGGVSVENTSAFMRSGAYAVGVGSFLANPELAKAGDWKTITERAKQFIKEAHNV
ncbi:bifunctional 4-hydroxy-2-oxoglutarate aldolase/2-dehydro-3-deoxy-phosphogluconate aldolase [Sphaerochaeta sp. S2]|jgi:2-dehydro-3-deoxyphosphogluconate aldolase/(4S)-4-hydroxy-2-oxoglutarate aldolase|uniref:bifunctional 4-hydroxy-2-oxoglutarate aldolase/2-dehydro-3-deoxy-phosphogluconate aldolase n=1 Tax=Sphaerochaeta sp. S2 TaxID=2798868 RepID=UPI0018E94C48|nr:bifunctional 4-hydroxy-2-oxoglutarate aldolase/2-dehydro-3-deoxy-phosphogluconate aldolase [Sphaerochaeta sp. S2]MBJ2356511.1 bifunctional 4-hydroxy-2-oxoglutarate aldolase/2-dehydro-3-deoxy-phosphogluconate aldolase [Sphaerochaeta sp. S2]MCK9347614.1 bifunctional 4-hydroxy-2-oxoglutarate aldolase/2-dehydro-3-deoxy-phosphogluconate aldolase [Sphaerochaeta sp.]MDD4302600.1 bifunctional 4-hydroxy-2-oxoglutarate aldolase/2-dehydro-3-deoxy-phosphogluconate aldolase [Sphaerochaeta sp.]